MSPDFAPPSRRTAPPPPRGARLGDLLRELGDASIALGGAEAAELVVSGVRQDSRTIEPGDLFVARRGRTVDGARFVTQAVERGAVAILAERGVVADSRGVPVVEVDDAGRALAFASASVYGHPTFQLDVVGITGTNGKTTTSLLVRAAVEGCGGRAGVIGTLGYAFADLDLPATHTSPEADDIARIARAMRDRGASHLIMEVSSIALAAQRVEAVRFRVAAFTNLTQDHLDFHGSMEAYAEAKARLFVDLAPGAVALNVDDAFGRALAARVASGVRLARTSSRPGAPEAAAELAPLELEQGADGIRMRVRTPAGEVAVTSPLLGAHNVDNLLSALAVAHLLDLDLAAAARAIASAGLVPGRLERCDQTAIGDDVMVLVDYAHTPDALARALATVRPLARGRVVCVFGCGGDRDAAKRPLMGEVVGRAADVAVLTNDNPRSEDPRFIADQVMVGLSRGTAGVVVELDRAAAIRAAVLGAGAGDVVLVAGKGHETYQIVGSTSAHFDDREVARAALLEAPQQEGEPVIYELFYPLKFHYGWLSWLNVLRYIPFRTIMATITAMLLTFVLAPWFIRELKKKQIGQVVRLDGPESHLVKAGTPTMGGALILLALLLPTVLWADLRNPFVLATAAVTAGYGLIGYLDDYLKIKRKSSGGLAGRYKLVGQTLIAGAAVGYTFLVPTRMPADWNAIKTRLALPFVAFSKVTLELPLWVYIPFAVFVVVAMSNAVNLTDGLDGLAIGPVMINAGTYLVLAYVAGATLFGSSLATYLDIPKIASAAELSVYCGAAIGAGIGFLWYNTYPAQVFMGDVGSLALGGGLGMLSVFTKNEFLSVVLGGIFVLEAVSVVTQVVSFKLTGKRIFLMAPIHHHYEKKGWAEPKIIVRFWIISILLALVSLASMKLR